MLALACNALCVADVYSLRFLLTTRWAACIKKTTCPFHVNYYLVDCNEYQHTLKYDLYDNYDKHGGPVCLFFISF